MWSNLANISSVDALEASQELPFPTGKETPIWVADSQESFFNTFGEYFEDEVNHPGLFEIERDVITDTNGIEERKPVIGEDGFPVLILLDQTPERLKLLAKFITKVYEKGLRIKGEEQSNGTWLPSKKLIEEWENATYNPLRDLGFTTPEAAYSALKQIKALIDSHNLYINEVDQKTREKMTKNQCQWAMYQVCSAASNLTELCTGVDVATAPIKDKKTGAVAQSPYGGADKQAAPGNHNTTHRSFQEGQIGKQCVGIGAVSIKVNSTSQYYADSIIAYGSNKEKARLLLPIVNDWGERFNGAGSHRGYKIGGKTYLGMANLYDKSAERLPENIETITVKTRDGVDITLSKNQPQEIIELLANGQLADDIPLNVAMSLAAMLSVAVDRY